MNERRYARWVVLWRWVGPGLWEYCRWMRVKIRGKRWAVSGDRVVGRRGGVG